MVLLCLICDVQIFWIVIVCCRTPGCVKRLEMVAGFFVL